MLYEVITALFLLNFAQNTEWTNNSSDNLIITVVGDSEVAEALKAATQSKKVGNRDVVVKEVSSIKLVENTHMLYLSESKSRQVSEFRSVNTLVITGQDGLCSSGADICFKEQDGKLRFEISTRNINAKKLNITSKLVTLGIRNNFV